MSAGIAVKTARIRTAPEALPTPIRGLTHTNRHYRSEGFMQPILTPRDTERFWSQVDQTATCWNWIGGKFNDGYGCFAVREGGKHKARKAHRISYLLRWQEIPDGLVLDHICRNRACVNPDHLRTITAVENTMIGISPPAINARKTECRRGHPFSEENTYWPPSGYRVCRTCKRNVLNAWQRRTRAVKRAERKAA